jgi:hypothetical protein
VEVVGAGTYPNRQVHVADNLSVTQDVNVGRNLSVNQDVNAGRNLSVSGTSFLGTTNMGSAIVTGAVAMGYEITVTSGGLSDGADTNRLSVCPSGDHVISGGCHCTPYNVLAGFPVGNTSWECDCSGVPPINAPVAYVICARIQY